MGEPFWHGSVQLPSMMDLPPIARAVLSKIALSVLFEDHDAYAPLHAAVRLAGFAASMYEEARVLLGDPAEFDQRAVIDAATRLEYAVISLHRAVDHVEAMRVRLGSMPGFALRATEVATRGARPIAITKLERRMLGDLAELQALRNALEHADERLLRGAKGDTMLVPRERGVSLDDDSLPYTEFSKIARGIISLADDILDAGSSEPSQGHR